MSRLVVDGQNPGIGGDVIPVGSLMPYAGASAPTGWLLCDGSAVSQATYAGLYAVIGTTYGAPGGGNFNLPDLRGKSPLGVNNGGLPNGENGSYSTRNRADSGGEETHVISTAEMPSHQHGGSNSYAVTVWQGVASPPSSGSSEILGGTGGTGASGTTPPGAEIAGSTGSAGSGSAHNTMHPYVVVNYIIKH